MVLTNLAGFYRGQSKYALYRGTTETCTCGSLDQLTGMLNTGLQSQVSYNATGYNYTLWLIA
jgi:hypothetical protein